MWQRKSRMMLGRMVNIVSRASVAMILEVIIQWLVRANMKILEGSLPSSKMEYTLSQIGSTIINGDEGDHRKINFNSEGVVKHQRQSAKASRISHKNDNLHNKHNITT